MKLFVWRGEGILTDYTNGIMFAIAKDVHEARKMIYDQAKNDVENDIVSRQFFEDNLSPEMLDGLSRDPEIFERGGFYLMGGG